MDRYTPSTDGEELFQFIFSQLSDDQRVWRYLESTLRPIGHSQRWSSYYRHHAAITLTCKLISLGKARAEGDPTNLALLATAITGYPWDSLNHKNRLLRFLSSALVNSGKSINNTTTASIKRFALRHHQHCYVCGQALCFEDETAPNFFSIDHLWPSSYGGNSIEENLLPACKTCNNKKGDMVSWISTDIHSLFLSNTDKHHLSRIQFKHRYAIFNRTALTVACENKVSLRDAFLEIGPWEDTSIIDEDMIADIFNVKTHSGTIETTVT